MDDARRLAVEMGPAEFLPRIEVLRGVPIEQITASEHRAKMFLHETLMAIQLLDTIGRTPGRAVQVAWNRALYAGKDLVLTVSYPAENEAPGAEPAEKGTPS